MTLILTILLFWSCDQVSKSKTQTDSGSGEIQEVSSTIPEEIALQFINSYVKNGNKMNESIGIREWVDSNNLASNSFKTELIRIIEEAYKIDPETGLGFDPILNAQDYPEEGFELESYDNKTNYLIVRGKNWKDYKLPMKMIHQNNKWLVDGCGIINIPNDKHIER